MQMSASDLSIFSAHEMESLLTAIEGAQKINNRSSFFLWAQGELQSLISHNTLIFSWGNLQDRNLKYDMLSRSILDEKIANNLISRKENILHTLIAAWQRNGFSPRSMSNGNGDEEWPGDLIAALVEKNTEHLLAHGALLGDHSSFFILLGLPQEPVSINFHVIDFLMPYMHMAVHRIIQETKKILASEYSLSVREIEVLDWIRCGKTNHEIAQILGLSPLTVKNHVQNILRKLNVSNRAQAVAKGIDANLFTGNDSHH